MDEQIAAEYAAEYIGKKINGWEITSFIDHGKSAVVFLAQKNNNKAAVKIFDKKLIAEFGKEEQQTRVEREKSLKDKTNSNLIQIYDGGYDKDTDSIYVIMEYLEWQQLAKCIETIPREKIWKIISQLVDAAKFLESHGYVHRDIKPQNIVVDDSFENIKLLDLGVLRPIGDSDITEDKDGNAQFIGTQRYASPEFLKGEVDDSEPGWRAVSIYQIGGVLYDLIERKPLFHEYNPYGKTVEAIFSIEPKFEADDIDPQLRHLAINCLLKDPYERLQLVSWENFDIPETKSQVAEIKKRIEERRKRQTDKSNKRRRTANTQFINEITDDFLSFIKQSIIDTEMFPPIQTIKNIDNELLSNIDVWFEPSRESSLKNGLSFRCIIRIISLEKKIIIIKLTAYTGLFNDETTFDDAKWLTIIKGYYDKEVMENALDCLPAILDSAQANSEIDDACPIWIDAN